MDRMGRKAWQKGVVGGIERLDGVAVWGSGGSWLVQRGGVRGGGGESTGDSLRLSHKTKIVGIGKSYLPLPSTRLPPCQTSSLGRGR